MDYESGWDIRKPLVEKVLEMFPGAQPITPKVRIDEHPVLQYLRTSVLMVFLIIIMCIAKQKKL